MKMNFCADMKDHGQFQWLKLQVSGHLECLLIITVLLETGPHGHAVSFASGLIYCGVITA